jgi:hypothetical protein
MLFTSFARSFCDYNLLFSIITESHVGPKAFVNASCQIRKLILAPVEQNNTGKQYAGTRPYQITSHIIQGNRKRTTGPIPPKAEKLHSNTPSHHRCHNPQTFQASPPYLTPLTSLGLIPFSLSLKCPANFPNCHSGSVIPVCSLIVLINGGNI